MITINLLCQITGLSPHFLLRHLWKKREFLLSSERNHQEVLIPVTPITDASVSLPFKWSDNTAMFLCVKISEPLGQ